MESITVRELQASFSRVEKILASGQTVEIRKRGELIGVLIPPPEKHLVRMPDFEARMRKLFPKGFVGGDRLIKELIDER